MCKVIGSLVLYSINCGSGWDSRVVEYKGVSVSQLGSVSEFVCKAKGEETRQVASAAVEADGRT